ncbi:helix-turn-helix domain-containing protein [Trinickia dinghuensis]|uniref:Helix-turn-helix domain-containing protein n=1 Tax=Trinickia dinghuensis TaxID=2291023 RepID=A0A3D8JSY9_9BURK|nr:helix-turn-helix domain-containing protein [Trinickia dinghuensis]RDU96249.1 helix-turn-helix domain-containing protein [Trinickia dinghuensis]
MEFGVRALTDVHDHSLAVSGWNQVYRQLSPGRFESVVLQVQAPEFLFFRESTNRRVAQTGDAPLGCASIALPLEQPITATFQGCRVDGYALMLLGDGEEFRFYTPESIDYLALSVPTAKMQALVSTVVGDEAVGLLDRSVLPILGKRGEQTSVELARFVQAYQCNPDVFANAVACKRFQDEILSALIDLFDRESFGKHDLTHATYAEIVRRSEKIIQDNPDGEQTILDLCVALRCSRRTLQTSFQRVANVSPVEYLRSVRLNGVRRLLRSTYHEELTVGDAAAQWGFTHLGYFAREYRSLFGELPSQTPRAH